MERGGEIEQVDNLAKESKIMSRIRKVHSVVKVQVALTATREDAIIAEISSKYGVHATMIHL